MSDISEVIAYIQEARAVGIAEPEISQTLADAGWQSGAIHDAFSHVGAGTHHHGAVAGGLAPSVISVRKLVKQYGNLTAVDDVSFDVYRGETFGILGPNGAGKTTTLEMIEGLKRPSSGQILVDGKDVATQTREVKASIGVQLQASSFFEELTLRELLETFGTLYGKTVDAMKLLTEVQLTDKAGSMVKELSGGQKQRFSIAVGLVNDPVVLFLDEPTTGLDPQARRNLWELVGDIKRRGTTVVLTTHYMDEAEVLCDRIAVMDHGKVVALDTTRNLLASTGIGSTIEFRSPTELATGLLEGMAGVESVFNENGMYLVASREPQATLHALFDASRYQHFVIDELRLKRASLEDVFLKLTGHQLRD